MIPVTITCEATEPETRDPDAPGRHVPTIRVNGEVLWRGAPVSRAEEAESVALGYLRYALGGLLLAPDAAARARPAGEEGPRKADPSPFDEVAESIRHELADGLRRLTQIIESGEWRRFLR